MKVNAKILGIGLVLIVIGLILIDNGQKSSVATPRGEQPTKRPITKQPAETLKEILGRAESIFSIRYDMITRAPGAPPLTQKVWLKGNKMRMEMTAEGETTVYLINPDAGIAYLYMPAENMAMKIDFAEAPESPIQSIEYERIEKYRPTIVGTETVDGKACIITEYIVEGTKTKIWIWKEKGFPIRMEHTTPEGIMLIEYKNIKLVDIPDSLFELPAGVQIWEMPMGIP